ncbi:MAG: sodium:solute symporter [Candidatus Eisenbacteria bacterium]|nr:sodium:solute symporter [Candidatus Eisenbacteria bacterium]
MSAIDWTILFAALAAFVVYGVWRGRGERNLTDFLLAGRAMRWPTVAISVMATQASAVTFLSTPGQGFADGLRFVQFYFGLPLAMIVVCLTAVPIFHRLGVFTAYEYLERRFDGRTRSLAAALFLIQRGLAAGITIYAPALVLSVILGWDVRWTCVLLGGLAVVYTTSGGSKAVSHTHVLQFLIIMATMVIAFVLVLASLPAGVSPVDAAFVAARSGKLNALQLRFDPNDRYNLWSGLVGGFFLQLSYFGTDQSQVGRYLTGSSVAQSRLGLVFNGLVKVPMQLAILSLGVAVFVFYQFAAPPLFFNPTESARLAAGPDGAAWHALEARQATVVAARETHVRALLAARHAHDAPGAASAGAAIAVDRDSLAAIRGRTAALIRARDPGANTSDTNYIFLTFVRRYLPVGLIGLVFAAIFAASMNSTSAELNALTSTTVVDVVRRITGPAADPHRDVTISRIATVAWTAFAVGFAEYASRLGSLIEAVNILGSLFYGTILGIFLVAFWLPRVRGPAVFAAALVAEATVIACFKLTAISFLWYNLIGCGAVVILALAIEGLLGAQAPARDATGPT